MTYEHGGYEKYVTGSERSAHKVVATLMPLLRPRSVVDVGCGTGGWLRAFTQAGVERVKGVDGPWSPAPAALGTDNFVCVDFEREADPVARLGGETFDLVTSLEFLEHVTEAHAEKLVDLITGLGDTLLISAAIPLQGGQHHVNERWPEYWTEKFAARGFVPFDAIRLALWDDPDIASWYRQNMLLYFRGAVPEAVRAWGERLAIEALTRPRALVHPEFYARRLGRLHMAVTSPLAFFALLRAERGRPERITPSIGNLDRHVAMLVD